MSVRDHEGNLPAGVARPRDVVEAVALVAATAEEVMGHGLGDLAPTDDLMDDVGFDSFRLLELGAALEVRIGLVLPESDERPTVGAYARAVLAATRSAG
jgi:acyl carrier protein